MTNLALIVAVDINNGISKNGLIPWKIKEDSNFFQDVTKRQYEKGKVNAVIMGKNTWLSFPETIRGLKDRINIVVSSTLTEEELSKQNTSLCEAYVVKTLDQGIALAYKLKVGHTFICGGSNIYKEALVKYTIKELFVTKIYWNYECDNVFPIDVFMHNSPIYNKYTMHTRHGFTVASSNNQDNKIEIEFFKYYEGQKPEYLNVNKEEQQYLDLLDYILKKGHFRQTRNSKTWSTFGKTMEFDLSQHFPILSTKRVFFRGVFEELLFFLKGDTNATHLSEKGVKIWDPNTTREFLDSVKLNHYAVGDMGPMYGFNWLHYNAEYLGMDADYTNQGFNQIEYCLNLLKTDPFSRRIIMTTFNPGKAKEGVLYPCHGISIMFNVDETWKLSCMMFQRSADSFCGVPFNISSYALLIHFFCEIINNDITYTGPKFSPGKLIMNFGDTHIYEDHYSETVRQVLREPYKFPQLIFKRCVNNLTDFKFEDIELVNYECYPNINVKMVA